MIRNSVNFGKDFFLRFSEFPKFKKKPYMHKVRKKTLKEGAKVFQIFKAKTQSKINL